MRILSCKAKNFGSYADLDLDLTTAGLSLVYGRTGSGKSTIPDVVAWTLFGTTAKDGAADDVRSWQAGKNETYGHVTVELTSGVSIEVMRVRGGGKNDLSWEEGGDGNKWRGKDITETQKLLEQRLGVTADLFIAASYFHEFSPTGAFFTAKAKERRNLFEKLASLELPKKLADRSSEERKAVKESHAQKEKEYAKAQGQYEQVQKSRINSLLLSKNWESNFNSRLDNLYRHVAAFEEERDGKIATLSQKSQSFEADKEKRTEPLLAKLAQISAKLDGVARPEHPPAATCPTCGNTTRAASQIEALQYDQLIAEQNSLIDRLEAVEALQNNYTDQIKLVELQANPHKINLEYALSEENPHAAQLEESYEQERDARILMERAEASVAALADRISDLTALYDLAADLRGELLKNAVKSVEEYTNKLLEKHFDAEIRVTFELDSDSLIVLIQKSGHDCNYKQLSKGQRGLLKLCFSVAVMDRASDRSGVHFSNLWFDEALDGLDGDLKIKAFDILQELSIGRDSVLVIDHAEEFKNLFDRRYHVTLEGDYSSIEVQDGL